MSPLNLDTPTPIFTPPLAGEIEKKPPIFTPPPTNAGTIALNDLPLGQLKQWLAPFFLPKQGMGLTDEQGWANLTGVTSFTYASADGPTGVITTSADLTASITVGARVRYTQTTVKYGIVTAIGSTTVTVYGGTDYTTANAAITAFSYSLAKAPVGFPLSPLKWTEKTVYTSNASKASPTSGTWYGDTGMSSGTAPSLSVPIGVWNLGLQIGNLSVQGTGLRGFIYSTLSTASNSASDSEYTTQTNIILGTDVTSIAFGSPTNTVKAVAVATKTTYYANVMTDQASMSSIQMNGGNAPTIIRAVCALL